MQQVSVQAGCRLWDESAKHLAAHLAGQGGQDVAFEDVKEAGGDLGADRQDLVQVQQLRRQADSRCWARKSRI